MNSGSGFFSLIFEVFASTFFGNETSSINFNLLRFKPKHKGEPGSIFKSSSRGRQPVDP